MPHTPKPWKLHIQNKQEGEYLIYAGGSSPDDCDAHIASVHGGLGYYDEGGDDVGCCESEANAKLLAAAPKLLSALKKVLEQFEWNESYSDQQEAYDEAIAAIREAE